ncbi:MAG: hypothetical protein GX595_16190 [Lentisphaerae bacterium]|nr:hypothetical protein [Lentisphaerota bacterium]
MVDATAQTPDLPILLLGIGRGGIRIADVVRRSCGFPELAVVAADSDAATLSAAAADRRLLVGEAWARGEGCGGDTEAAERAVSAATEELRGLVKEARMIFVAAGLGGGIGSVLPRVIARLAREAAVPVVVLVTTPFSFEGAKRAQTAEVALSLLRAEADAVIAVPNSLLFARLPPDTASHSAFDLASDHLGRALAGLARVCCAKGLLTADMAGVKRLLRRPGCACTLAMGQGRGPAAAEEAFRDLLASPFIGDASRLEATSAALLTLLGGETLSIGCVQDCLERVHSHLPRHAQVLVGAYTDARLADQVQLTCLLVAEAQPQARSQPSLLPSEGTGNETAKTKRRRSRRDQAAPAQDLLPLIEQQLGIFAGSPQPTFLNGENLDVPTFQRRNIVIDAGEDLG